MRYYYAKSEYGFINYLFRKDLTYTRLPDTKLLKDTIIYNSKQIDILRKIHPDLDTLLYKYVKDEVKFKTKSVGINLDLIIKHLS